MSKSGENRIASMDRKVKVKLPEYSSAFPVGDNPLHGSKEMEEWEQWMLELSGMPRDVFEKTIESTKSFARFIYPFCNKVDRYEYLAKYMMWFLVIDDHLENHYDGEKYDPNKFKIILKQLEELFDKILTNKFIDTHKWKPYIFCTYSIFDSICSKYNDEQKARFRKTMEEFFEGCRQETIILEQNYRFKSIEEYIELRNKSIGIRQVCQVCEFADEIVVPEKEYKDPIIQELLTLTSMICAHTNDIYSFNKELGHMSNNDKEVFNMVFQVARFDQISYDEAMLKVVEMLKESETKFSRLQKEALNSDRFCQMTKKFVERIAYVSSGNWKTYTVIKRYTDINTV